MCGRSAADNNPAKLNMVGCAGDRGAGCDGLSEVHPQFENMEMASTFPSGEQSRSLAGSTESGESAQKCCPRGKVEGVSDRVK